MQAWPKSHAQLIEVSVPWAHSELDPKFSEAVARLASSVMAKVYGPGTTKKYPFPHQGEAEKRRRRRQLGLGEYRQRPVYPY